VFKAEGRVYEQQEPSSSLYNDSTLTALHARLDVLQTRVADELLRQGFTRNQVKLERMLHMRFNGSDTSLMM
jgi:5-oxoprolinase (ATP-hydrolysing)